MTVNMRVWVGGWLLACLPCGVPHMPTIADGYIRIPCHFAKHLSHMLGVENVFPLFVRPCACMHFSCMQQAFNTKCGVFSLNPRENIFLMLIVILIHLSIPVCCFSTWLMIFFTLLLSLMVHSCWCNA